MGCVYIRAVSVWWWGWGGGGWVVATVDLEQSQRLGSAMYGAYMLKREWTMMMGQATQEAGVYNKWAGENGMVAEYGEGGSLISSPRVHRFAKLRLN